MLINVTIEGSTPLLCNKFTDAQAQKASSRNSQSINGDRGTEREIAESKLYTNDQGKPCIPQPNILRCIVDAGRWHKAGKKQLTTKTDSIVYTAIDIIGILIPIKYKAPWSVDVRPVVNPSTKGRILCYRPRFDDWTLSFEMELDQSIIGVKLARQLVDDAGTREGLGDFRPNRKGPFGRFKVTHWKEQEIPLSQAAE